MPVAQMMGLLMAEPVATVVTDAQPVHGSGSELTLKEMVDFLQQQLGLSDKFNAKQIVDAACEQLVRCLGLRRDGGKLFADEETLDIRRASRRRASRAAGGQAQCQEGGGRAWRCGHPRSGMWKGIRKLVSTLGGTYRRAAQVRLG